MCDVLPADRLIDDVGREQYLRHGMVELPKEFIVHEHQLIARIAARACFLAVSSGRLDKPSFPIPTPIAPEETRMISLPAFCRSLRTLHRASIWRMFIFPLLVSQRRGSDLDDDSLAFSDSVFHHKKFPDSCLKYR